MTDLQTEQHQRIDELERVLADVSKESPANIEIINHFAPGLYAREMRVQVPAGKAIAITSKIHKTRHLFTLSAGKIAVMVDGVWQDISAPHTSITEPGTRRVAVVLEDVVWTTYHPTELTDVDEIEALIIEKHDQHIIDTLRKGGHPCLG